MRELSDCQLDGVPTMPQMWEPAQIWKSGGPPNIRSPQVWLLPQKPKMPPSGQAWIWGEIHLWKYEHSHHHQWGTSPWCSHQFLEIQGRVNCQQSGNLGWGNMSSSWYCINPATCCIISICSWYCKPMIVCFQNNTRYSKPTATFRGWFITYSYLHSQAAPLALKL